MNRTTSTKEESYNENARQKDPISPTRESAASVKSGKSSGRFLGSVLRDTRSQCPRQGREDFGSDKAIVSRLTGIRTRRAAYLRDVNRYNRRARKPLPSGIAEIDAAIARIEKAMGRVAR